MASANTLCKKLLNVKGTITESYNFFNDTDGVAHVRIKVRVDKRHDNRCPICGKRCSGYDHPSKWYSVKISDTNFE